MGHISETILNRILVDVSDERCKEPKILVFVPYLNMAFIVANFNKS